MMGYCFTFQAFILQKRLFLSPLTTLVAARIGYSNSNLLQTTGFSRLLSDPSIARNFDQVLKLLPTECNFDDHFVKPLLDTANLSPASVVDLLEVALSPDLGTLLPDGTADVTARAQLLQPSFVLSELINPMARFGVKSPERAIRRCPSLFTAALVLDGEQTRLLAALTTLRGLLTKKDLGTLVKHFPS